MRGQTALLLRLTYTNFAKAYLSNVDCNIPKRNAAITNASCVRIQCHLRKGVMIDLVFSSLRLAGKVTLWSLDACARGVLYAHQYTILASRRIALHGQRVSKLLGIGTYETTTSSAVSIPICSLSSRGKLGNAPQQAQKAWSKSLVGRSTARFTAASRPIVTRFATCLEAILALRERSEQLLHGTHRLSPRKSRLAPAAEAAQDTGSRRPCAIVVDDCKSV